jgi:hypothetical protein
MIHLLTELLLDADDSDEEDETVQTMEKTWTKENYIPKNHMLKRVVSTIDRNCVVCCTTRNIRRWPAIMYYSMLKMAAINSIKVYINHGSIGSRM